MQWFQLFLNCLREKVFLLLGHAPMSKFPLPTYFSMVQPIEKERDRLEIINVDKANSEICVEAVQCFGGYVVLRDWIFIRPATFKTLSLSLSLFTTSNFYHRSMNLTMDALSILHHCTRILGNHISSAKISTLTTSKPSFSSILPPHLST